MYVSLKSKGSFLSNRKLFTTAVKKIHLFASVWYEIGVIWANITNIKSHTTALGFKVPTDINQIFQMKYCLLPKVKRLQKY